MRKSQSKIDIYDMVVSACVSYKANNIKQQMNKNPLSMDLIANCFDKLKDKTIVIGKKYKYNLQDFLYDSKSERMVLLINRNDPDAKNPIFRDTHTNKRRSGDKKDSEGIDYSCHIVINLKGIKDRYTVAIEKTIPGVPIDYIRRLVNQLINMCSQHSKDKFEINHPSGEKDEKGNHIKLSLEHEVSFAGHVSNDFVSDIEKGVICEFDLIDTSPDTFLENTGTKEKKRTIALEVIGNKIPENNSAPTFLSNIFKKYGSKYDLAKLKFTTQENADKIIRLNTDSFTINGKEYIKSYFVRAPINQDTSYDKIQAILINEMSKYIN